VPGNEPVDAVAGAADGSPLADEARLWQALRLGQDRLARGRIILRYLPFARVIARSVMNSLSADYLQYSDLVQFATVGLIEAIDRFDAERRIPFKAFAEKRVRGAVLNGISTHSELHAQQAFRQHHRRERLAALKSSSPARNESEIFSEMIDLAVGLAVGLMLEDTAQFRAAPEALGVRYGEPGELASQSDLFRRLLSHLPETERLVLELHYDQNFPFSQVAQVMSLSKGRISQLHKSALAKLRELARSRPNLDLRM